MGRLRKPATLTLESAPWREFPTKLSRSLPLHPAYVTLHPCNPASNYLHVPAENFTNTLVTQSVQQAGDNSFVLFRQSLHSIGCETANRPFGQDRNILNQNQSRTDAMELIESSKECNPCGNPLWNSVLKRGSYPLSDEAPSLHKVFM